MINGNSMIPELTTEDKDFITAQLREKGFSIDKDIFDRGYNLFADMDRFEWDGIALQTNSGTPAFSHYFIFGDWSDGAWNLYEVRTQYHWNTNFNEAGVGIMTARHNTDHGPIPTREQIEADILRRVAQQQADESFLLNDKLKGEFHALGFLNYVSMLKTVQRRSNLAYLATSRPLAWPAGFPGDRVDFRFIIVKPKDEDAPHLSMMKLSFVPALDPHQDRQCEFVYSRSAGGIPTMLLAMEAVKDRLALRNEEFDRIVRAYGFVTDQATRANNGSQLRIGWGGP
jgi:hypothetical protein